MPVKQHVTVENRVLSLTNLDKVLYPAAGFTKADVIDYYTRVSKWLLPHLRDRPVTLKRFPDGVEGQAFYEKNAPRFTPDWVQTVSVPRREGDKDIRYIVINDLPTLVWCANLASLELHPFLHLASNLADRLRHGQESTPRQSFYRLESELGLQNHGQRVLASCKRGAALRLAARYMGGAWGLA